MKGLIQISEFLNNEILEKTLKLDRIGFDRKTDSGDFM